MLVMKYEIKIVNFVFLLSPILKKRNSWYTVDPIHRGPLFREIQHIANCSWTQNLP